MVKLWMSGTSRKSPAESRRGCLSVDDDAAASLDHRAVEGTAEIPPLHQPAPSGRDQLGNAGLRLQQGDDIGKRIAHSDSRERDRDFSS